MPALGGRFPAGTPIAVPLGMLLALAATVWLAAGEPAADRSWDQTLLTIRGQLGLGTPVGIGGLSGEINLARFAAVELGVGHNGVGPQLAGLGHGRLPLASAAALTLGLGLSRGAYEYRTNWLDGDHSDDTRWNGALFGNAQLGFELLAPRGFSLR